MVRLLVNGGEHRLDVPADRTLLTVLRDDLGLTGAKDACGERRCGACTVLVDGRAVLACGSSVGDVDGASVTTIEGLAGDRLHPVQQAFVDTRALQCGYCTPGMVLRAVALLGETPRPDADAVRAAMSGNICRCGGYPKIVDAVLAAAAGAVSPQPIPDGRDEVSSTTAASARWTVRVVPGDGDWGWSTPGGALLTIDDAGRVRAFVGKVDAGQGNRYALIRLVAAELGVSTSVVGLEMGDTARSPFDIGTFGSRSTPDAGHALRLVAAAARRALVEEAALRWETTPGPLRTVDGCVHDDATGRSISYGELVAASATREIDAAAHELARPPAEIATVDATALRRGTAAAVTGAKKFPSDIALPGMLHARVLRPPASGAEVRSVDTAEARRLPGVFVVEEADFVAVAAADSTLASAALGSIRTEWAPGRGPGEGELETYLREHPAEQRGWGGMVDHAVGDVDAAVSEADVVLAATYTTAYIAHVPMETRVAVAAPAGDAMTVWMGTQRPFNARDEIASTLGVPPDRVRVVVPDFGGASGGKHSADVGIEAARIARALRRPVRVAWTREEEFRHAYFRPAAVIDVRATASAAGDWTSWEFTNTNSGAAALDSPYDVGHQRIRFQPAQSPFPQGSYRALAATANNFARESHVDELAHAVGVDAVELRLRYLRDERLASVLRSAADSIGWSGRPQQGPLGIGIACGLEKDARVATAAEVHLDRTGRVEVRRIVTAFDCGRVVDPEGLRLQIVGATIMGLGGALFEAIRFDAGRILNADLTSYRVPRFGDVPAIEVIVLDRPDVEPAGAGETPIIAVAPAIANAIRAASGVRLRSLPLIPDGVVPAS